MKRILPIVTLVSLTGCVGSLYDIAAHSNVDYNDRNDIIQLTQMDEVLTECAPDFEHLPAVRKRLSEYGKQYPEFVDYMKDSIWTMSCDGAKEAATSFAIDGKYPHIHI